MGKIKLLDCTLRDGGYINNWEFGNDAIVDMTERFKKVGADIIELGFIKNEPFSKDRTVFNNMSQVKNLIGEKKDGIEYAVMAEVVNPLPLDMLEPATAEGPDIIRVIVWKRMLKEGFEYCKGIVEKGYKLCVQPARVNQYSDEEFIDMIKLFNQLNPMAIYVVDSWGTMYKDELLHYFQLADKYLAKDISIGYHGHNNMMQAFEVACKFIEQNISRDLIIDSSVYGIGRGAGNLNTELFAKYMNEKFNCSYNLDEISEIYDRYISEIYKKNKWGYSVPYFITAKYNCNPNFASYYEKKNIPTSVIKNCISLMSPEERIIFNEEFAENILRKVQKNIWQKMLGVIILTANRPEAIDGNLAQTAKDYYDSGVDVIIYDSSNDDATKEVVSRYNSKYPNIKYDTWDGEYDGVSIDNKVIDAYAKYSQLYEYVWVTREGTPINIKEALPKIKDKLLNKYDLIVLDHESRDYKKHGNKDYTDCKLLFKEQAHQMTVLGSTIINSKHIPKIIELVPLDKEKNYGIWQPIAFLTYFAAQRFAAQIFALWLPNNKAKTSSHWHKRTLWQWGERWYKSIMALPSIYDEYKPEILKFELIDCKPFSVPFLLNVRKMGGLTFAKIKKYKKYIKHVCNTPLWQFYLIACIPRFLAVPVRKIIEKRNRKRKYFPEIAQNVNRDIEIRNFEINKNCFELTKDIKSYMRYNNNTVEKPFITVFIPTYKRVDLLKEAVGSVLSQVNTDFEWDILIVDNEPDNGRPNNTEQYIRSLNCNKITYYRNAENLRVGDNFNRGISLARAPWVMMLHDDDMLMPNTIKKMGLAIEVLSKEKGKPLGAVSTSAYCFKYNPETPDAHKKEIEMATNQYLTSEMSYKFYKLSNLNVLISGHIGGSVPSNGSTFNKQAVLDFGGFNDDLGISADLVLLYCMEQKYSIYQTLEPYGFYRWGINSMSKPENTYKTIKDNFEFREYIYNKNLFNKLIGNFLRSVIYYEFTNLVLSQRRLVSNKFAEFKDYSDIYNKQPYKFAYRIWRSFIRRPYQYHKKIQMHLLKQRFKKYIKNNIKQKERNK